jgi:hypothetical protein
MMSEDKGKIYHEISRLPQVSYEARIEISMILLEAAKEVPVISNYYVEPNFNTDDHMTGGHFRYEQYVHDIQKWQKKWFGTTKRESVNV